VVNKRHMVLIVDQFEVLAGGRAVGIREHGIGGGAFCPRPEIAWRYLDDDDDDDKA
jgi:hypothetical protein